MSHLEILIYKAEGCIKKQSDIYDNVNWKKASYKTVCLAHCSFYKMRAEAYTPMFIINRVDKWIVVHSIVGN